MFNTFTHDTIACTLFQHFVCTHIFMSSPDYVAILQRARMKIEQWSIIQGISLFKMAKVSLFGVPRKATMLLMLLLLLLVLLLMHAFSILMVFKEKKVKTAGNKSNITRAIQDTKGRIFALAQRNSIGMQKQTIFCTKILFLSNFTVYIVAVRNVWWHRCSS